MPTVITGTDGVSQVQTGAVESGDLPAGSVIQVVQTYIADTGSIETTSQSEVGSGVTVSITPTSTDNYIIIQMDNPMVDVKDGSGIRGRMFVNNSPMSGINIYHAGYQDQESKYASWAFSGKYTPTDLSTLTFEPFFVSENGGTVRFSYPGSSISLIAMEIAG